MITFDATLEELEARNEQLKTRSQEREQTLTLVLNQLNEWELLVLSLLHGINSFGIYMSVTDIAKHAGRPRTAVEDFRKSAYKKLGSAVVRLLLQDAAEVKLTPFALAKEARKRDRKATQELRQ